MKIEKYYLSLASAAALLGLVFYLNGCGANSDDVTDVSGDHAAITAAAVAGGAVAGSDSGSSVYFDVKRDSRFIQIGTDLFGIPEASATACSASNETCASGIVTVAYAGCTSKNGRTTFTGGYTLTLGGTVLACPGTGFWHNFFTSNNATLFRTFTAGTSLANVNGVSVTADNTAPVGWDSAVTLNKHPTYATYGTLRKVTTPLSIGVTTSVQTLMNYGVEHVATGKKAGKSAVLWDHTISFGGTGLSIAHTFAAGVDTKVVNSADANSPVIVQHNLAKWTARNIMKDVTYKHGTASYCGCFPVSGTINAVHSGSKTSAEQLTFTYDTTAVCGSYNVQTCSDSTCTTLTGAVTAGVLNHCL